MASNSLQVCLERSRRNRTWANGKHQQSNSGDGVSFADGENGVVNSVGRSEGQQQMMELSMIASLKNKAQREQAAYQIYPPVVNSSTYQNPSMDIPNNTTSDKVATGESQNSWQSSSRSSNDPRSHKQHQKINRIVHRSPRACTSPLASSPCESTIYQASAMEGEDSEQRSFRWDEVSETKISPPSKRYHEGKELDDRDYNRPSDQDSASTYIVNRDFHFNNNQKKGRVNAKKVSGSPAVQRYVSSQRSSFMQPRYSSNRKKQSSSQGSMYKNLLKPIHIDTGVNEACHIKEAFGGVIETPKKTSVSSLHALFDSQKPAPLLMPMNSTDPRVRHSLPLPVNDNSKAAARYSLSAQPHKDATLSPQTGGVASRYHSVREGAATATATATTESSFTMPNEKINTSPETVNESKKRDMNNNKQRQQISISINQYPKKIVKKLQQSNTLMKEKHVSKELLTMTQSNDELSTLSFHSPQPAPSSLIEERNHTNEKLVQPPEKFKEKEAAAQKKQAEAVEQEEETAKNLKIKQDKKSAAATAAISAAILQKKQEEETEAAAVFDVQINKEEQEEADAAAAKVKARAKAVKKKIQEAKEQNKMKMKAKPIPLREQSSIREYVESSWRKGNREYFKSSSSTDCSDGRELKSNTDKSSLPDNRLNYITQEKQAAEKSENSPKVSYSRHELNAISSIPRDNMKFVAQEKQTMEHTAKNGHKTDDCLKYATHEEQTKQTASLSTNYESNAVLFRKQTVTQKSCGENDAFYSAKSNVVERQKTPVQSAHASQTSGCVPEKKENEGVDLSPKLSRKEIASMNSQSADDSDIHETTNESFSDYFIQEKESGDLSIDEDKILGEITSKHPAVDKDNTSSHHEEEETSNHSQKRMLYYDEDSYISRDNTDHQGLEASGSLETSSTRLRTGETWNSESMSVYVEDEGIKTKQVDEQKIMERFQQLNVEIDKDNFELKEITDALTPVRKNLPRLNPSPKDNNKYRLGYFGDGVPTTFQNFQKRNHPDIPVNDMCSDPTFNPTKYEVFDLWASTAPSNEERDESVAFDDTNQWLDRDPESDNSNDLTLSSALNLNNNDRTNSTPSVTNQVEINISSAWNSVVDNNQVKPSFCATKHERISTKTKPSHANADNVFDPFCMDAEDDPKVEAFCDPFSLNQDAFSNKDLNAPHIGYYKSSSDSQVEI